MSTKTTFYLNGSQVNPPRNWQELELELNFDRDGNVRQRTSVTDFEFVRENADLINANLTNGRLFEGLPFGIEVSRGQTTENVFTGYLDLTQRTQFSSDICNVRAVEKEQIDWLNDVADGFTFEYLKDKGIITKDDYDFMPYVINSIPNYQEVAIAIIGAYVVTAQIVESIEKVKNLIAEISNPTTAVSGIVKASLLVIYLIGLLISIVKFVKELITNLIQPVKYHACMSVKKQLQKACQYLGLNFQSSIFFDTIFEKMYIMPQKYYNPVNQTNSRIFGYTSPNNIEQLGEFKGTFGDLLRAIKGMFNAKVVIKNSTLYFERRDYNILPPQYNLPDPLDKYSYPNYTTNADEFDANYYLKFQTDLVDKNTIHEYLGTGYQVILNQQVTANTGYELMKGLKEIPIPFALAKRKTELNTIEKVLKTFLNVLDAIINSLVAIVNTMIQGINAVLNLVNNLIDALDFIGININFNVPPIPTINYVNLSGIIENRIDMMKIEIDITSTPKVFLMDKGSQDKYNKLTSGNETYLSAKYLYNNYHYINSFLPSAEKPKGNQYLIREFDNVPFSFADYLNVKDNNQINYFGEDAEIESVKWNPYQQKAYLRVRINTLLTSNLTQTILEPNGQ